MEAEEKKASRASKLQAWKQQQQQQQQQQQPPLQQPSSDSHKETALRRAQEAAVALASKVASRQQPKKKQVEEEELDPLDAYLAAEVLPEVKAREEEEKKKEQEEKEAMKELLQVRMFVCVCSPTRPPPTHNKQTRRRENSPKLSKN